MIRKFIASFLLLLVSCSIFADNEQSWTVDKFMRFQIAYLPDSTLNFKNNDGVVQKPLLTPDYAFDITNINLANFLAMGFDLPKPQEPKKYNFYLKLYNFPEIFSSKQIISDFLSNYALNKVPQATDLNQYIAEKHSVLVKMGTIARSDAKYSAANPIPKFVASDSAGFVNYFSQHIPYYSLYLIPTEKKPQFTSQDAQAKWSTNGVKGFYADLLKSYNQNLKRLKGIDDTHYYFLVASTQKTITILKIPKEFLTFANWRDLPMPQDPNKIFLSSLLLVSKTEYVAKGDIIPATIPTVGSAKFKKLFTKQPTKVLEVCSVVYL